MLLASIALMSLAPAAAGAISDEEELTRFGSAGPAAGQLNIPRGVATNSTTGAVFVADSANNRISKFDPWGEFIEAWGWGVLDGKNELQHCTAACQAGIEGTGSGQLNRGGSIAVDEGGNVYLYEGNNHRIQKFSPTGEFMLMIGGEVDKTTGENLCTAASGDECGVGLTGSGPGEFSVEIGIHHLAVDLSGGRIFLGDKERIQIFGSTGVFESELPLPGKVISGLAYDSAEDDFYAMFSGKPGVERLSLAGELLDTLPVPDPEAAAVDSAGNVYVINGGSPAEVLEFNSAGDQVSTCCAADPAPKEPAFNVDLNGIGTNTAGDIYVTAARGGEAAYVTAYGPPPTFSPPPPVPPTILGQTLISADAHGAVLRASINPHFWQNATYYVEYGTGKCSEGGCANKEPVPPALLTPKAINKPVLSGDVALSGLESSTRYHYRFVSESGGGGPAFGIEATFTTFAEAGPPETNCPNQAFRTGASLLLPDCRAYEMVSPVDKANGDIVALIDVTGFENRLNQSSVDGDKLTYSSYRAFAGSPSASYTSQYIASRGASGWASEALGEPRGPGSSYTSARLSGENEYKAFSSDLCNSWLVREADPQLAPGAVAGFPNVYRRANCPRSYEAITTVEPPDVAPAGYVPEPQGYSADGSKAIFRVNDNLTVDAPPQPAGCVSEEKECLSRLYESSGGELKLVCILPDGTPNAGNCSAGSPPTAEETSFNRTASVDHAMSEDGSRVYWSASSDPKKPGRLYLRLNGQTTVPVSGAPGAASSLPAQFWGASADGSRALFTITQGAKAGNLYRYDLGEGASAQIAGKVIGVAGASEDLSYVYFISEEAIGGQGTAGRANLYLHHEGTSAFIATLSSEDVRLASGGLRLPSDASAEPVYHAAQVSPDGRRLAFISTEPLSGFDNTDTVSGKADSEVFTYAAETDQLDCASCSPVGASPVGRAVRASGNEGLLWTAAFIPTAENQLYTPRVISEDGNRLLFTSYADILPQDTNGMADVYEWERSGRGGCSQAKPAFYAASGGCLYLISSGKSPQDSEFVDASPEGEDVFFSTGQSLLSQDPGLIDIYDARVGGGFPAEAAKAEPCAGEACQPAVPAPGASKPGSDVRRQGNPAPARPPCAKGKARRKGRCVSRHAKKHRRRHHAGANRGAAR